jgi:acetyltransferase-like isoleucine patch superfamily enzyme
MARLDPKGYISPNASIYHNDLLLDKNVFIGDRVNIYKAKKGGSVKIGKGSFIHQDTIIETGYDGNLTIGANTHIQPRCQFSAYLGSIFIGNDVQIAPNCAFYPYGHNFATNELIKKQPLETKGDIIIEDDAWLGVGVIVLENVSVGKGSVIGAGAVVTHDIPELSIAVGNPARVIKHRRDIDSLDKKKPCPLGS